MQLKRLLARVERAIAAQSPRQQVATGIRRTQAHYERWASAQAGAATWAHWAIAGLRRSHQAPCSDVILAYILMAVEAIDYELSRIKPGDFAEGSMIESRRRTFLANCDPSRADDSDFDIHEEFSAGEMPELWRSA